MTDTVQIAIASLLLAFFAAARPTRVTCPVGWYVEGVRPSGVSRCVRAPAGRGDAECVRGSRCDLTGPPEPSFPVAIYCTGGAHPIVVNARTVGCQR